NFCYGTWYLYFFFFSSRRRHTRSKRDWSSDVCSSDLDARQFWGKFTLQLYVFADETGKHFGHIADDVIQVERTDLHVSFATEGRSEERRVGKECRYRW